MTTLDELRELSEKATPGPWTHGRTNWRRQRTDWWGIFPPRRISRLPTFSLPPKPVAHLEDEELDQADAALIVAAVNYVRELLAEPSHLINMDSLASAMHSAGVCSAWQPDDPADHERDHRQDASATLAALAEPSR